MKVKEPYFVLLTRDLFNKYFKDDKWYVFGVTLAFYFLLFFNLNNKTLAVFFALFLGAFLLKIKNLCEVLFWGLISSLPFLVGKTYYFQLISPVLLYQPKNPDGYQVALVLTISAIIALFMIPYLIRFVVRNKKNFLNLDFILLATLIFLYLFSTVNSKNPPVSFLLFLTTLVGPIVFLFSRNLIDWQSKRTREIFVSLLFAQVIFEFVLSFLQFIHGGPLGLSIESTRRIVPFGSGADEDVWRYRPVGTFEHANFLAIYLTPLVLLSFSRFYEGGRQKIMSLWENLLPIFAFGLGAITIILTLGRSAWASLAVGFLLLTYILEKKLKIYISPKYQKILLSGVAIILLISPFFIIPRITKSFNIFANGGGYSTRTLLFNDSLKIIEQNFIFGTGMGMSVPEMFRNNPTGIMYFFPTPVHNWYLYFASETGILSLLVFLFLLNSCLRKIFLIRRPNIFTVAVFASLASAFFNGFFQPFLGSDLLIYAFMGILSFLPAALPKKVS